MDIDSILKDHGFGGSPPIKGTAAVGDVLSTKTFMSATGKGLLTGTMPNNGNGATITPGTTNKTVAAGYWATVNTVAGETNLVTANIKSGTTIFGVAGQTSVVDTSDTTASPGGNYTLLSDKAVIVSLTSTATVINVTDGAHSISYSAAIGTDRYVIDGVTKYFASEGGYVNSTGFKFWTTWNVGDVASWTASVPTTAGQILTGVNAYANGVKLAGSMPKFSGTKYTPTAAGILIPAGYHDGTTETAAEPNLVATNIKNAVSIFGITGTLTSTPEANGTATSNASFQVTVSGLSFQPKIILVATNATNFSVYSDGSYVPALSRQVSSSNATSSVTTTPNASGFTIGVPSATTSYSWIAIG